ncbi:keratin, type II cytoskeletal 1-like [Paramacrobiotus metropolitanus]|uniref:keratin, type II cytoskeletal 1-like n=1 Tax=Paramacrobiotus metropolitanus TaxID=2943436 RepID=UPI0024462AC6|nr:keratin, type II cytoskeletal 1-like [Paramacrobiotus metropolitanus]
MESLIMNAEQEEQVLSTQEIVDKGMEDISLQQSAAKLEAALEYWQKLAAKTESELKGKIKALESLQAENSKLDAELEELRAEIQATEEANAALDETDCAEKQAIRNMEQEIGVLMLRNFEAEEMAVREIEKIEMELREAEDDCREYVARCQNLKKVKALMDWEAQQRGEDSMSGSVRGLNDSIMEVESLPTKPADISETAPVEEEEEPPMADVDEVVSPRRIPAEFAALDAVAEPPEPAVEDTPPITQGSGSSTSELAFTLNRESSPAEFFSGRGMFFDMAPDRSGAKGGFGGNAAAAGRFHMFGTPSPVPSENSNDGQVGSGFGGVGQSGSGFGGVGQGGNGFCGGGQSGNGFGGGGQVGSGFGGSGGGFGGFSFGGFGFGGDTGEASSSKSRPANKKNDGGRGGLMF